LQEFLAERLPGYGGIGRGPVGLETALEFLALGIGEREGVVEKVRGEVDIRAFFLGTKDKFVPSSIGTRQAHRVGEKPALDDQECSSTD